MEGERLTFFVIFNSQKCSFSLSEYDTVATLKTTLDMAFDIAVSKQCIDGWKILPTSDCTILKTCFRDRFNVLTVRALEEVAANKNDRKAEERYDLELQSIQSLRKKLPSSLILRFEEMLVHDAVSYVSCKTNQKKAILLYFHYSQDSFSDTFLKLIQIDTVKRILDSNFLTIGWDIEETRYHNSLVKVLESYSTLSAVASLVTEKSSAVICFLPTEESIVLFSCLRKYIDRNMLLEHLENVEEQRCHDENEAKQLECIQSLRNKLTVDAVTFRSCALDDAIHSICKSEFDERKSLLLYLHKSNERFSQTFTNNLVSGELANILNRNFLVLGWDLDDPKYHSALTSALDKHINLAIVSELVKKQVAFALCILPVNGTISVHRVLRGEMTIKDMIKILNETEKVFKDEIKKERELKQIEIEKGNANDLGSEKLQAIWADMLGDRDYDCFEFDEHHLLKNKIGFALKGSPQNLRGYDDETIKNIEKLYAVIKGESDIIAELKDRVEVSFIYNCLEPLPTEKVKRAKEYRDYNPITDVNPVPIFILRKCRGSKDPCRIIVDDSGRVYQSWREYLLRNKLPKAAMVVPLDGRYTVKDDIEKHLTPACHIDAKLLLAGDIITTVAGLASGGVFITASLGIAVIPVSVPALIAAGAAGAIAGGWAIGRSAYVLYDRTRHKQSLSFANSEARGAYLNIVAGSLGFVGAGANIAITQLVARGVNIGRGATYVVNTVGVLNLGAGGVSLGNSGYEVIDQWINSKQPPSALTILQLTSSILFFGHAVYNFKGAQTIIDETQARVLKDYQDSLRSNRHRKVFTKLMKETIRIQGDKTRGRSEVISAIRNIRNKDEVFAVLTRNNKAMNEAGIKFSADSGQISFGGIPVDMNEFIGMNKKKTEVFLSNLAQERTITKTSGPSSSRPSVATDSSLIIAIKSVLSDIKIDGSVDNMRTAILLTKQLLHFCSEDIKTKVVSAVHQVIDSILKRISKPLAQRIDKIIPRSSQYVEFLKIGISFFSKKVDEWETKYQLYTQGDKQYFNNMFTYINPSYVKRIVDLFEFVVRNSYSGESLIREIFKEMTAYAATWISKFIIENEENEEREKGIKEHSLLYKPKKVDCKICGGYYFSGSQ